MSCLSSPGRDHDHSDRYHTKAQLSQILTAFATLVEVSEMLQDYATLTNLTQAIANLQDETEVQQMIDNALNDHYTAQQVDALLFDLPYQFTPTPTDLTLLNGWVASGEPTPTLGFTLWYGVVHLVGRIEGGPAGLVAQLPSPYRPRAFSSFPLSTFDGTSNTRAVIKEDGDISVRGLGTGWISFDGICFPMKPFNPIP